MTTYHRIRTAGDARDEKISADAIAAARDAALARIAADRKTYVAQQLARYPQIGVLNGGTFYAFVGNQYVESVFLNRVIEAIETNR